MEIFTLKDGNIKGKIVSEITQCKCLMSGFIVIVIGCHQGSTGTVPFQISLPTLHCLHQGCPVDLSATATLLQWKGSCSTNSDCRDHGKKESKCAERDLPIDIISMIYPSFTTDVESPQSPRQRAPVAPPNWPGFNKILKRKTLVFFTLECLLKRNCSMFEFINIIWCRLKKWGNWSNRIVLSLHKKSISLLL